MPLLKVVILSQFKYVFLDCRRLLPIHCVEVVFLHRRSNFYRSRWVAFPDHSRDWSKVMHIRLLCLKLERLYDFYHFLKHMFRLVLVIFDFPIRGAGFYLIYNSHIYWIEKRIFLLGLNYFAVLLLFSSNFLKILSVLQKWFVIVWNQIQITLILYNSKIVKRDSIKFQKYVDHCKNVYKRNRKTFRYIYSVTKFKKWSLSEKCIFITIFSVKFWTYDT